MYQLFGEDGGVAVLVQHELPPEVGGLFSLPI